MFSSHSVLNLPLRIFSPNLTPISCSLVLCGYVGGVAYLVLWGYVGAVAYLVLWGYVGAVSYLVVWGYV